MLGREEEEEFHNNKCLQPHWAQLPRSRPRDSSIASTPGRLLLSLLSPWLCWSSRACVLGVLGMAGGQHWGLEVDAVAPYGVEGGHCKLVMRLGSGCCSSLFGLEMDTAALGGVRRWIPWLPMRFGNGCCRSYRDLEVNTMAAHGIWKWMLEVAQIWMLQLPVGFGVNTAAVGRVWRRMLWIPVGLEGGHCHSPCGFLPLPTAGSGTMVQEEKEEEEEGHSLA